MNVDAYLARIGYDGPRTPSLALLRALQSAHLLSVPFENLDIHARQPIVLDEAALFAKVVTRRRGGFCYELNGLFAALLRTLGFDVERLAARVQADDGTLGPEFDHMTLLVRVDGGRWLADVGFGRSFRQPLALDAASEDVAEGRAYRAVCVDGQWRLQSRAAIGDGPAQLEYLFALAPQPLSAFVPMCHYHQTSPSSHFTRNVVCSLATRAGRVTLSGDRLIVSDADGERDVRIVASRQATLRQTFGMLVPPSLPPLIRPVQPSDVPSVVELVRTTLAEFGLTFGSGAATDDQLAQLPQSYDAAGGRFWVATLDDGRIVGTCGLFPLAPGTFELRKMYLTPAARGHRLGQRLLDEAIAFARASAGTRIVLDTVDQMTRAIAFYEANGFVRDDTQCRSARCSRGYVREL